MQKAIPASLYHRHKNLIETTAWKWCWESGFDIEEMISEGALVLCECYNSWNKTKSAFTTWLITNLNFRFQDMIWGRRGKYLQYTINTDVLKAVGSSKNLQDVQELLANIPEKKDYYETLIEDIPGDCKRLIRIVLTEEPTSINALAKILREKGWKWDTIEKRIKRVKDYYKENRL